jgi:tetratricopeptide (TPR) repeat protein
MLEVLKKHQALEAMESQLPENSIQLKQSIAHWLKDDPFNHTALLMLARCQLSCGETDEAVLTLESLLNHNPDRVPAKVELARIKFAADDAQGAIRLMEEATQARPEIIENWQLLSEFLHRDGQKQASRDAMDQYDMIKAFNKNLTTAERAFANSEFVRADNLCRQLLELVPNEVRVLRLLARLAKQFRHYEISTSILARCVETRPTDVAIGLDYARALLSNRKFVEALEQCQRLIELAPENIDIYDLKAELLYNLGRYEEAIAIYRELSEIPEKSYLSLLHLGKVLKTVGETRQAVQCFQQASQDERIPGQAYWELANLKTYRFSGDEITSMKQLIETGELSEINRVLVHFALGKAMEDTRQFADSFQHYQTANDAYTILRPYRYTSETSKLKSFFTAEYFADRTVSGSDSEAPIFVVGLPRSGSTLVEQILSSHSQVDATMELTEIVSIVRELNGSSLPGQGQYPRSIAKLNASQVGELAQRYLNFAQPLRQNAPHFVDKQPNNFNFVGLIKTLFPRAKIIDIRRNPMASGWSLYRHFFADSFLFSYDLTKIGKYYNDYIALMQHWHSVLPGQILTINYEDLIADLPTTVESILQYCELKFEENCLDFHLNKRAVATPSSEQVRRPLYTDAIDHWKNYEEFLTPLKQMVKTDSI